YLPRARAAEEIVAAPNGAPALHFVVQSPMAGKVDGWLLSGSERAQLDLGPVTLALRAASELPSALPATASRVGFVLAGARALGAGGDERGARGGGDRKRGGGVEGGGGRAAAGAGDNGGARRAGPGGGAGGGDRPRPGGERGEELARREGAHRLAGRPQRVAV